MQDIACEGKSAARKESYARGAVDILQHRELMRILKVFYEKDIETALLKGAFLKNKVYSSPLERPMGDIDLLIRRDACDAAVSALKQMGYRDLHQGELFGGEERGVVELARVDGNYTHMLDLHTQLVNLPGLRSAMDISSEMVWNNAESFSIEGLPCFGLSPELLLLYLCYHISIHHGFHDSLGYADFHEVLKVYKERFSWDDFFSLARRCGMRRVAYFALREARVEEHYKNSKAVHVFAKGIMPWDKIMFHKLLARKNFLPHGDYVFTVFLIDGMIRRAVFCVNYVASWLRAGAAHGGTVYALRHVGSRFLNLCRTVFMLFNPSRER